VLLGIGMAILVASAQRTLLLLVFVGAVAVFIAFSFLALNYLPGPDWFCFLVGFAGLFWMAF
jgi:hypothetical protein